MDPGPLVENQIHDGAKFVERLIQEGFDITAAAWISIAEDGQWFLYIASPVVAAKGPLKAYRRALAFLRQMPEGFWVELTDVKLIKPTDPIAKAVVDSQQRKRWGMLPLRYAESQFAGVNVEGAYLYPPVAAVTTSANSG